MQTRPRFITPFALTALLSGCLEPPVFDPSLAERDAQVGGVEGDMTVAGEMQADEGLEDLGRQDLGPLDMTPDLDQMMGGQVADQMIGGLEDMELIDLKPPCEPSPERCDGLDNDCDEQVDEAEWAYREDLGLKLTFDEADTILNGATLRLIVSLSDGQTQVVTVDPTLEGWAEVELQGATSVRVNVSGDSTWSYRVARVEDLEGHLLPEPYPSAQSSSPDATAYLLTDNLGGGPSCGSDEGVCELGVLTCVEATVSCVGGVQPTEEVCNGLDDDCNGFADDELPPVPCSGEGVCGLFKSECVNGQMSSCEPAALVARGGTLSDLISDDERCDCYDNDCDGEVDEGIDLCVPTLNSDPITAFNPPQHCHYRPGINDQGQPVDTFNIFLSGARELGSLTIHDGATVWVRKPLDLRNANDRPGYMPSTNHTACEGDGDGRVRQLGGQLTLLTDLLRVEQGGVLTAHSAYGICYFQSLTRARLQGASGGDLRVIAGRVELLGELSANGSSASTSDQNGRSEDTRSGGAAGSIWLTSPDLALEGLIRARGGRGYCTADSLDCNGMPSPYAGGGPGGLGGAPINEPVYPWDPMGVLEEGGAGSGGSLYTDVDVTRSVRITGRVTSLTDTMSLEALNGNDACDGVVELAGATRGLISKVSCVNPEDLSLTRHELTLMALNAQGRPVIGSNLQVQVRPLSAGDDEWVALPEQGYIGGHGALSFGADTLELSEDHVVRVNGGEGVVSLLLIRQGEQGPPAQVSATLDEQGDGFLFTSTLGAP